MGFLSIYVGVTPLASIYSILFLLSPVQSTKSAHADNYCSPNGGKSNGGFVGVLKKSILARKENPLVVESQCEISYCSDTNDEKSSSESH